MHQVLKTIVFAAIAVLAPLAASAGNVQSNPNSPAIVGAQLLYCPTAALADYKCTFNQVATFVAGAGNSITISPGNVLNEGGIPQFEFVPNQGTGSQSYFYGSMFIGGGGTTISHVTGYDGESNTIIGILSGINLTTGSFNTLNGWYAGAVMTTGHDNVGTGEDSLGECTTCYYNAAYGGDVLRSLIGGNGNSSFGVSSSFSLVDGYYNDVSGETAEYSNVHGYYNTIHGVGAGYLHTGNLSVVIGANACADITSVSSVFCVDGVASARGSPALDAADSLMYGVFASSPASQSLTINAALTVTQPASITTLALGSASIGTNTLAVNGNATIDGYVGINSSPSTAFAENMAAPAGKTTWQSTAGVAAAWQIGQNVGTGTDDTTFGFYSVTWGPSNGYKPLLNMTPAGVITANGTVILAALAGTGSRPLCITSTGQTEAGSLSSGLVTCP